MNRPPNRQDQNASRRKDDGQDDFRPKTSLEDRVDKALRNMQDSDDKRRSADRPSTSNSGRIGAVSSYEIVPQKIPKIVPARIPSTLRHMKELNDLAVSNSFIASDQPLLPPKNIVQHLDRALGPADVPRVLHSSMSGRARSVEPFGSAIRDTAVSTSFAPNAVQQGRIRPGTTASFVSSARPPSASFFARRARVGQSSGGPRHSIPLRIPSPSVGERSFMTGLDSAASTARRPTSRSASSRGIPSRSVGPSRLLVPSASANSQPSTDVERAVSPSQRIGRNYSPSRLQTATVQLVEDDAKLWTAQLSERAEGLSGLPQSPSLLDDESILSAMEADEAAGDAVRVSHLPLELFDDPESETHSPEEWLSQRLSTEVGTRAFSRYYMNNGRDLFWCPCYVLDFSPDDETFGIVFRDIRDAHGASLQKRVRRFNLRFEHESEYVFFARMQKALDIRDEFERHVRTRLFLDRIADDLVAPFQQGVLEDIIRRARVTKAVPKMMKDFAEQFVEDLVLDYQRSVKRAILDYDRIGDDYHLFDTSMYGLLDPVSEVSLKERKPAPFSTLIAVSGMDRAVFADRARMLTNCGFTIRPEVFQCIMALSDVVSNLPSSFLRSSIPSTVIHALPNHPGLFCVVWEKFEHAQLSFMKEELLSLGAEWNPAVESVVVEHLFQHIDFYAQDIPDFDFSDAGRFERLLFFLMTSALRRMVLRNVDALCEFFSGYIVEEHMATEFAKIGTTELMCAKPNHGLPLFFSQLSMSLTEDCRQIELKPSISDIIMSVDFLLSELCKLSSNTVRRMNVVLFPVMGFTKTFIPSYLRTDTVIHEAYLKICNVVETNLSLTEALLASYRLYAELVFVDETAYMAKLGIIDVRNEEHVERIRGEIGRMRVIADKIRNDLPEGACYNMIFVDCSSLKTALLERVDLLIAMLFRCFREAIHQESVRIVQVSSELRSAITRVPSTPEEMVAIQEFVNRNLINMQQLHRDVKNLEGIFDTAATFQCELPGATMESYFSALGCPLSLATAVQQQDDLAREKRHVFMEELVKDTDVLSDDIQVTAKRIDRFVEFSGLDDAQEFAEFADTVRKELADLDSKARLYNTREVLFSMVPSNNAIIEDLKRAFEPFDQLWTTCWSFLRIEPDWLEGPFMALDPVMIEQSVKQWLSTMRHLKGTLSNRPSALSACCAILEKLEEFWTSLPLVKYLRNPGLKSRHWKDIQSAIGIDVFADETVSLSTLIDLHLSAEQLSRLQSISDTASREFGLERGLDRMQSEWRNVQFDFADFPSAKSKILKGVSEVMNLLDDHIVRTQGIIGHPNIAPLLDRSQRWITRLVRAQEVLESWMLCQKNYCYLQPVFASEDIQKQLVGEAKKFAFVDRSFRRIMDDVVKHPNVLNFCTNDNLFKMLQECNLNLDAVLRGLSEYLETKRLAFPRLFFLSNDELLSILSETKDPLRIQPHLRKCFESIHRVHFDTNNRITCMLSADGEAVVLAHVVDPSIHDNLVEKWLAALEESMQSTLRITMWKALEHFSAGISREEWILAWPGQVVLTLSQLIFTREVIRALEMDGRKGVLRYSDHLEKQMRCLVDLVRDTSAATDDVSLMRRATLSSLIVLDVHARDVVSQLLADKVHSPHDWSFEQHMRYYWDTSDAVERDGVRGDLSVRMMHVSLRYAYEYLGNQPRLVITPLTDRCFRTLIGALHVHLGGAPEGPAGTGKTETTKDLAKAVAKQCVVFNCSDGLDYVAMGKFFKGLVGAGAWCCLDEFNRIDPEVLSVVAQQILSIQLSILGAKDTIVLEGTTLRLNPSCAVFITMNPGYAGRAELPDNLKALFRPVAMMVPDYALIAEISLLASGFYNGRALSQKLVVMFRLCAEQLSPQQHYDYGMRAVKAVLVAAADLKRVYASADEEYVLLRAVMDVNLPKFLARDVPLFEGIISDLFPGLIVSQSDGRVESAIVQACSTARLEASQYFVSKCVQFVQTLNTRHGVMLVGRPLSGKSAVLATVASAFSILDGVPVDVQKINPKAISSMHLFGALDHVTHEWKDGVLARVFRSMASSTFEQRRWLVLDGPVDAGWVESLNTVLDDNKKLCLVSGETISLSRSMRIVFEVRDLESASPATVSRCGMVYAEPSSIGWKPLLISYLRKLRAVDCVCEVGAGEMNDGVDDLTSVSAWTTAEFSELETRVNSFCNQVIPKCTEFLNSAVNVMTMSLPDNAFVQGFLKLFDAFIRDSHGKLLDELVRNEASLCGALLFCTVWSFGAAVEAACRNRFDAVLRLAVGTQIASFSRICLPPSQHSVYDVVFDASQSAWILWNLYSAAPTFYRERVTSLQDVVVPTEECLRVSFLSRLLLKNGHSVLLSGPTGVGKSVVAHAVFQASPSFLPLAVHMSGRVGASEIQSRVDAKLDKRRHGVYGPPLGQRAIIYVEDAHMPRAEKYGSKPPLELLRQSLDQRGWYDVKTGLFHQLEDTCMLACWTTSSTRDDNSATRIMPEDRFLRHLHILSMAPLDDDGLRDMFRRSLVCWSGGSASLPLLDEVIACSVHVYRTVLSNLLPTPAKAHYLFNVRDIAQVIAGMTLLWKDGRIDQDKILRLWYHETLRVYCDRLSDPDDFTAVVNSVEVALRQYTQKNIKGLFARDTSVPGQLQRTKSEAVMLNRTTAQGIPFFCYKNDGKYDEYVSMHAYKAVVTSAVASVAAVPGSLSTSRVSGGGFVPFSFHLEHIARIERVLRREGGHVLLVGIGGTGRRTCARIASAICGFDTYEISPSLQYSKQQWREDLKRVCAMCGSKFVSTVMLINDVEMPNDGSAWEDIHVLMTAGELHSLYGEDEWPALLEPFRVSNPGVSADRLRALFWQMVRGRLHWCICLSPAMQDDFRERILSVPSLIQRTTVDWFLNWPAEALHAVADHVLRSSLSVLDLDQDRFASVLHAVVDCYMSVPTLTPSYLFTFLATYSALIRSGVSQLQHTKGRYEMGLSRLRETENVIQNLQNAQELLFPVLERTRKETLALMSSIDADRKRVDDTARQVALEEEAAAHQAEEQKAIRDDCERDLAKALPALDAALAALRSLDRSKIAEMKAMKNPSEGVRLVMETVCHMFGVLPVKIQGDLPGKYVEDYWAASQRLLSDVHFLDRILSYDKDALTDDTLEKIRPYLKKPDYKPEKVRRASVAAEGLCRWVRAMDTYHRVVKIVAPKKESLAVAESKYAATVAELEGKRTMLKELQADLDALLARLMKAEASKQELESRLVMASSRLDRAKRLLSLLADEKTRWSDALALAFTRLEAVVGDILVCSCAITYCGSMDAKRRTAAIANFQHICRTHSLIPPAAEVVTADATTSSATDILIECLGDPLQIREWNRQGLPPDTFSASNAVIVENSLLWPLFIDPQGQANVWIRAREEGHRLMVLRQDDDSFLRNLENAMTTGVPCLIENVGDQLDASLQDVFKIRHRRNAGLYGLPNDNRTTVSVVVGDALIEVHSDFRLYLTSTTAHLCLRPEDAAQVCVVNFAVTRIGLADQLLSTLVAKEQPKLADDRSRLLLEQSQNAGQLRAVEDRMLDLMNNASFANPEALLDDEQLIAALRASKQNSLEILDRVKESERAAKEMELARAQYYDVASHATTMFFISQDLRYLNPMYVFSLQWFSGIFLRSIQESRGTKAVDISTRVSLLCAHLQRLFFASVSRSLFDRDRLLFAFLIALRMGVCLAAEVASDVDVLVYGSLVRQSADKRYLGSFGVKPDFLSAAVWDDFVCLCQYATFGELLWNDWLQNLTAWRSFVLEDESPIPSSFVNLMSASALPSSLVSLLIHRAIRRDKVLPMVRSFIRMTLGPEFLVAPQFSLPDVYQDSAPTTPVLLLLGHGVDPVQRLFKFADNVGFGRRFKTVSLGQGQGPIAAALIKECSKRGEWLLLQNCHLATSWLPQLSSIIESLDSHKVSPEFRLWLTSLPAKASFPNGILQHSLKVTLEPPVGISASLTRSLTADPSFLEDANSELRRLFFSMITMHAVVQERTRYGPLGWNVPYQFTDADLAISLRQSIILSSMYGLTEDRDIDQQSTSRTASSANTITTAATSTRRKGEQSNTHIPFRALRYLVSEINYGGRVTDDWDRRLLSTLSDRFIDVNAVSVNGYRLVTADNGASWAVPTEDLRTVEQCSEHILKSLSGLSTLPTSSWLGLHANAEVAKAERETRTFFDDLIVVSSVAGDNIADDSGQLGASGASASASAVAAVRKQCIDLLGQLPGDFDLDRAAMMRPLKFTESLNIVLSQELFRYNRLLQRARSTLRDLLGAIDGTVVLTEAIDQMMDQLFLGRVPSLWESSSYPSGKPLGSYMADLIRRLGFLQKWIDEGAPSVFWFPAIFFPQSFTTAVLQAYARKHKIAIDRLAFHVEVVDGEFPDTAPADGCYIYGLFLEGAKWSSEQRMIVESDPRQLHVSVPVLWLQPCDSAHLPSFLHYVCPVFRTLQRRGALSTTGHSTNYVMSMRLPTTVPQHHWIQRSVALFLSLDV